MTRNASLSRRALVLCGVLAVGGLGLVACSDDDGNDNDLDNPIDGVDDQIDDGLDELEDEIDSEVTDP